jgi:ATP-dependent RNA circularization protein (DNA/RNA ligase family)
MKQYHKIQTVYKREQFAKNKLLIGEYSMPEFEYLKNNLWVFTEKVDGTNIRVMFDGSAVTFGGKTDNAQMPVFLLYKLQELFEGTPKRELFKNKFVDPTTDEPGAVEVCLYGEGYGAKIQKGGGNYVKDGVDFVLFDVWVNGWWLEREAVEDIAKHFGIKAVPIIGTGTLDDMIEITKKGFLSEWGEFTAEGIIAKPLVELKTRRGDRVITKIKHKDFL